MTLRYGIMCSDLEFGDWSADAIRKLNDIEDVSLELMIIDDTDDQRSTILPDKMATIREYQKKTTIKDAVNKTAWWAYRKASGAPESNQAADVSDIVASVNQIYCSVTQDGFSQYFRTRDIDKIGSYNLDFILKRGFGIIRGDILQVAKHGIWSYHHADERIYRGGPPCFWEIYEKNPVTGAILQVLTDRLDGGKILKRGTFPTHRKYKENLDNVYYGSTEWPAQVAIDILSGRINPSEMSASSTGAPIYRSPSPSQILLYKLRGYKSLVDTALSGIDHWKIGVFNNPIGNLTEPQFTPQIEWFEPHSHDFFLADPFAASFGNSSYVFMEHYSYEEAKGKIAFTKYPDEFNNGTLHIAHEESEHMSYPYLIRHRGAVYAAPEIFESNEIRLYKLRSPSNWEYKATLVENVEGVDPTIIKYKGYWWMFYTQSDYSNTKLFVQYSSNLESGWRPHENNPVKTDVRSARPAGTPFKRHGELYRPAQDCSTTYGAGVILNKVAELSKNKYRERPTQELRPNHETGHTGLHTVSGHQNVTFIDAKRQLVNKYALKKRLSQVMSVLGRR